MTAQLGIDLNNQHDTNDLQRNRLNLATRCSIRSGANTAGSCQTELRLRGWARGNAPTPPMCLSATVSRPVGHRGGAKFYTLQPTLRIGTPPPEPARRSDQARPGSHVIDSDSVTQAAAARIWPICAGHTYGPSSSRGAPNRRSGRTPGEYEKWAAPAPQVAKCRQPSEIQR